jgi:mRNA interferase MazF
MDRGDLYTAQLDTGIGSEPAGTRPVLLVSTSAFNHRMQVITALPLTRHDEGMRVYPNEAIIRRANTGLSRDSIALAHQIRALDKARLGQRIGAVDATTLSRVDEALRVHLAL